MRSASLAVVLIVAGCHPLGDNPVTSANATHRAGETAVARAVIVNGLYHPERRCGVNFDATISVDAAARQEASARFGVALPAIARDLGCSSFSVSLFTDGGWFTPVTQFRIPAERHEPCTAGSASPAERVLQPFLGFKQLVARRCAEQVNREDRAYFRAREQALAPVRAALRSVAAVQSSCTDIYAHVALLDRISRPADIDFIVTDGAQNCGASVGPFAVHHAVCFIIVPSTGGEAAARRGIQTAVDLTQQFRGSRFLVPAELTSDGWWLRGVEQ